jgi:hypothetical protein
MSNKNIKIGIQNALLDSKLKDNTDKLIASCLIYEFISRMLEQEDSLKNDIRVLADNYKESFTRKVLDAKNNLISYDLMREKVLSFKKNNFISFTSSNVDEVNKIYLDKTLIKKFSTSYFSQYMYKLLNISEYHYTRLSKNHFNVMAPIVSFYVDKLGIKQEDTEVLSSLGFRDNPGKEVVFKIKGVEPGRVIADINSYRIPIKASDDKLPNDFFSIRIDGDYLRIIFN